MYAAINTTYYINKREATMKKLYEILTFIMLAIGLGYLFAEALTGI
jgi:hypothetical protein